MGTAEQVDLEYKTLKAIPIIAKILERLWKELPRDLYYHSAEHSEDVLREVISLAIIDQRGERERHLLAVSAAYHDSGFLRSPLDNERYGARFAVEAMTYAGGYSPDEIELVSQMILDTRLQSTPEGLRQVPTRELSGYLLDADMSNLGRDDFFDKLELLRREFGFERVLFLRRTYDLILKHQWHTPAAQKLRTEKTKVNIQNARESLAREEAASGTGILLGTERLSFLARLPLVLSSSFSVKDVIERSIDHLRLRLDSEAATVFLLHPETNELTFWALRGGESGRLSGVRIPAGKGIVGWVIENNESARIDDVANDKRFFSNFDEEGEFKTKNMLCVPLSARGEKPFGAVQVLNRHGGGAFNDEDLQFLQQFAALISLSLDSARLLEKIKAPRLRS